MLKRIAAACICCMACAGSIFAQERYTVEKVVAVVGNSAIKYSELMEARNMLVEERRKQGYTSDRDPVNEALEGLLVQKLLYNQALIDSVTINLDAVSAEVESRLAAMTEQAGSTAALETEMGMPYYEIRQDFKGKYEEMYYAQAMRDEVISKVKITPGEVERFYRQLDRDSLPIVPEQYVYAQIVRYPVSGKEARQRVREELLDMRERVINGTRFDLLARMYSVDPGTAMQGGEMDWMSLNQFVQPFADALEKLQPGQISEVVETEYGYHIIQLLEKRGDRYRCRHILLRPVYTTEELAEGGRFLDSLANQIRGGAVTFEEAAKKYSDDKYSRQNGGIVTNHELLEFMRVSDMRYSTTRFLREDLRMDYPALSRLREGEISSAFQSRDLRNNELNKIVKLIQIIPAHPASLNEDYLQIEALALQAKQEEEFVKWLDGKIDGLYVRIEPEFREGDFENRHWIK